MAPISTAAFDHCTDEDLMSRLFELCDHADEHKAELAALDAAIQARLAVTYTPEPGHSPRQRVSSL